MECSQGHSYGKADNGCPQGGSCGSPVKAGWGKTSHSEASPQFWWTRTVILSSGSNPSGLVIRWHLWSYGHLGPSRRQAKQSGWWASSWFNTSLRKRSGQACSFQEVLLVVFFFFFLLRKSALLIDFALILVSKSVFPHTRDIQRVEEKPCKLLQGQLASLENRIKGFIFPSERLWMK